MNENKKPIVSYEDDDEDIPVSPKRSYESEKNSSKPDNRRSSRYEHREQYNDHLKKRHSHHHSDYSSSRTSHRSRDYHHSSRDKSHRSYHDRSSRSPLSHKHRSHRSRSREHEHHRSHHIESRSPRRSRKHGNCRKSKRDDRSHSRSKEYHHSSHRHRSRSSSKERKSELPKPKVEDKEMESKKLMPNSIGENTELKSIQLPSITPLEQLRIIPSSKESVLNPIVVCQPSPLLPTPPPQQQKTFDIPKYYNSKVVNPSRIAEQVEKRKLLWGDSKTEKTSASTTIWTNLKFQGEHGSAMTEKFRKLMGIKSNNETITTTTIDRSHNNSNNNNDDDDNDPISTNQAKLFKNLDKQYSIARLSTHMNRGAGLGFSGSSVNK